MKINHGVKFSWKDKYDPRKLKRSKKFGAVDFDINSITEFDLCPDVTIFNQAPNGQETYMCTAMANCGVSSIQEGVDLSPEYAYQKTNFLMGVKTSTGADPYKALSVHTKFGCIERKDSPLTLGPDSKFLIENPDNWDKGLDEKAKVHKKRAYFDCDQGKDKFESILAVMWESYQKFLVTKNKSDLRPVSCGFYWFGEMQYAPNGIVPNISKPKKEAGNHNVYARLVKKINGEWCIGFTNSYGREVGDNGVHYMTRDVVNRYIVFKETFEDLDPNEEKKAQWGWVAIILNKLVESLTKLSELLQKKEELKQEVKIETKPEEPMNKIENLNIFAKAIQDFEGWAEGSRSFRNNNPGNLRGLTEYTKSLGATEVDEKNFCKFPSYGVGFEALKTLVKDASQNKLKAYKNCTILSFFQIYAPSHDNNNPYIYANHVSSKLKVVPDTLLSTII